MARDQSKSRRWSVREDSYLFGVRIKQPLLDDFKAFCEETGATPSDVMRRALKQYINEKRKEKQG